MKKILETIKRKWAEYLLEIIVITISILGAFMLENWNEERNLDKRFNVFLEQLYNSIDRDVQMQKATRIFLREQQNLIQILLDNPAQIADEKLIHILFYIDTYEGSYSSETNSLLDFLEYNANDSIQNRLSKQITTFIGNTIWEATASHGQQLTDYLLSKDIPQPSVFFKVSSYRNFEQIEKSFYDDEHLNDVKSMIQTRKFISILKSLSSKKSFMMGSLTNAKEEGESMLQLIKEYSPEIRLLYDDIGIIGSAVESGWYKSIPLSQLDPTKSIWTIELTLTEGFVKFRIRDNWSQNWGGTDFPKGETVYFGDDIPVAAGDYVVTLDLEENTYSFELNE